MKCRKNKNPNVAKINKGRLMISTKCAVHDNKKQRFIKGQETKGLLNSLGIKTALSKTPLIGDCFKDINECNSKQAFISRRYIHAWDSFNPVWI